MPDLAPNEEVWPPGLVRLARWGPLLIVGYFALQALGRTLVSPALELDEAEQVLATQQLALGYGPQPPLYTWLQLIVFRLLGEGVPALTVLKNALLALTVWGALQIARRLGAVPPVALLAALSLFLVPPFAWEAQRDLSHSVLALATTTGAVLAFLGLLARGHLLDHLLFGIAVAACVLAKYNAVILPMALILAALPLPACRAKIATGRFAIAALAALVLVLPHGLWAASHPADVLADAHKFSPAAGSGPGRGLLTLAGAILGVVSPALVVLALALIGPARRHLTSFGRSLELSLLIRALGLALALVTLLVALFDVSQVKERWLLPTLFLAPVIISVDLGSRLGPARVRALTLLAGGLALLVLVMLIARAPLGPRLGDPNRLNFPITTIANQIRADGIPDLILSASRDLGGNLRLAFPSTPVVVPVLVRPPVPAAGCWLLVWEDEAGPALPLVIGRIVTGLTGGNVPPLAIARYQAPLAYGEGALAAIHAARLNVGTGPAPERRIEAGCPG